ncbi:phosphopantothenoylcysteine decarboxylase isoform X4 [Ovis aries]|uniref:phosphopantothenoylcysteine decarboxylase isoform X4 n=1 Tax=Ovis aries TaxID=9940 RepID=UPI001C2EBC58|nr:phosphopantothenoylcysteine decarboxylase isoform X4 [Ovis aries]XP_060257410.1 phosphopantothenoylcysteine decarboxylase isoform X4 [Ovis aries]XP_060257411.1 phosphopantothenoylcysteine decarboxylase isoform X4 [Ovis aries]XP_060257412.1 phosphopantothenoylcysteine decarboxylase isoform X4 [Ovis aries]XP_060257413.1 phosphopantothenoylcysteine decarboxylase isoform X4 [Ovis aries]XP_060257414.1 phosphopantothenoylcysteine decarboxylase isoform X4 [Ovis aries]
MEPNSGRLPGLEATGPHMEPRATCSAAAPLRRQFRVLVGVTGSVAALKLPLLVSKLLDIPDLEVAVVTTERAKHFYSPRDVPVTLYSDADEWEMWKCRSDPVLHIDLRRWADLMLVAPLDANTLGKVASGICDNLLLFYLPGTRPCVDRHTGRRELTVWKERVFGLCSGMRYVSPLTMESPCCTVSGIQLAFSKGLLHV